MSKKFLLVGIHRNNKPILINQIDALGGKSVKIEDIKNFIDVTAVVVSLQAEKLQDKLKTPLATDVLIVDQSYIKDCSSRGDWLPIEFYDIGQERFFEKCKAAKLNVRPLEERINLRKAGGLLKNWTVIVLLENVIRRKTLERTIILGGGKVLNWTKKYLSLLDPLKKDIERVNYIFTEPAILLEPDFQQFLDNHKSYKLPHITFSSYVGHFITSSRHSVKEYSIFLEKVIKSFCDNNEEYNFADLLKLAKRFTVGASPHKRKRSRYYDDAELLTEEVGGTFSPTSPSFSPLATSVQTSQSIEFAGSFGTSQSPVEATSAHLSGSNSCISPRSSDVLLIESPSLEGIQPIITQPPTQAEILPKVSKAKDIPKKSSNLKRERLRRGASGAERDGSSSDGDAYLYEPPQPKSKLTQAGDKQDQSKAGKKESILIDIADSDSEDEKSDDDIQILAAEDKNCGPSKKQEDVARKETEADKEADNSEDWEWGVETEEPEPPVVLKEPYEAVFDLFYNEDHADLCDRNRAVDKYKEDLIKAYKKMNGQELELQ